MKNVIFASIMISIAKTKLIRSLDKKKYREKENAFVAEGPKIVGDLLETRRAKLLVATQAWLEGKSFPEETEVMTATDEELRKVSFLQHPQQVLGVFPLPLPQSEDTPQGKLSLMLDNVQDPGNLGTIIRVADWFGIETIYCSPDTADAYNPKVVQATMGSIARVNLIYRDLASMLDNLPKDFPVYGTLLSGDNIYHQKLSEEGIIVMGNEGKGISPAIAQRVTHKLLIPNYPSGRPTAESLNVAIATAITCSEFRRNGNRSL